MIINDIKVQDEKIVIITEDQILKALGLSNKRYELYEVNTTHSDYIGEAKIVIKVRSMNTVTKQMRININEAKTLDAYIGTSKDLEGVTVTFGDK